MNKDVGKPDRPESDHPEPDGAQPESPKAAQKGGCFTADELPKPPPEMRRPPQEIEPGLFDELE